MPFFGKPTTHYFELASRCVVSPDFADVKGLSVSDAVISAVSFELFDGIAADSFVEL
jgi:hypothetical protein